jgi:hypothetical protein
MVDGGAPIGSAWRSVSRGLQRERRSRQLGDGDCRHHMQLRARQNWSESCCSQPTSKPRHASRRGQFTTKGSAMKTSKNPRRRKLNLNTETLATLTPVTLDGVQGGDMTVITITTVTTSLATHPKITCAG